MSDRPANSSRRDFIRNSSLLVAGGALVGGLSVARSAHAAGSDTIKVGLVGCGGRGTGAAIQALNTTGSVKLTAMADAFEDRLQAAYRGISSKHKEKVDVPKDRQFVGLDAFKNLMASPEVHMVILATPPGFRPLHFETAVKAGKHVFMEKPVATDAPGVRQVLAATEEARQKGLAVAVGLQRRHEEAYRQTIAKLQEGAIGDVIATRVYWNNDGVWVNPRQEKQTEIEYQMRNWYYFNWLCGDHINEQHIHNLDVINWLKNGPPVEANGMGGREVRKGKEYGQIFDHHFVEYTYADSSKMFSQCRHIKNTWSNVSEHAHGTKGHADISGGRLFGPDGKPLWSTSAERDGHQVEHHHLFRDIRDGKIPNEGEYGALSTMTAILGRLATYSGKVVKFKDALNSNVALADFAALHDLKAEAPVQPDKEGYYPVPVPGQEKVL